MEWTLYMLCRKTDGKRYVGVTNRLVRRLVGHRRRWANFDTDFIVSVLGLFFEKQAALTAEDAFISALNTLEPNGLNRRIGTKATEVSRARMRAFQSKKNGMLGRKHGPETRALLRAAALARTAPIVNGMKGRKHTEESKQKIRDGLAQAKALGKMVRKRDPDSKIGKKRANKALGLPRVAWNKGKQRTATEKKNISDAVRAGQAAAKAAGVKLGRPHTEASKAKLSEAKFRYHEGQRRKK